MVTALVVLNCLLLGAVAYLVLFRGTPERDTYATMRPRKKAPYSFIEAMRHSAALITSYQVSGGVEAMASHQHLLFKITEARSKEELMLLLDAAVSHGAALEHALKDHDEKWWPAYLAHLEAGVARKREEGELL